MTNAADGRLSLRDDFRKELKDAEKQKPDKKESDSSQAFTLSDSCFSKSICSSTDCTGLIPALPSSEAELEAYEEMYQFCMPSVHTDPDSITE